MWLANPYVKNPSASVIKEKMRFRNENCKTLEVESYLYSEVVQYLLLTYVTDDVIAEALNNLTRCTQPAKMLAPELLSTVGQVAEMQ